MVEDNDTSSFNQKKSKYKKMNFIYFSHHVHALDLDESQIVLSCSKKIFLISFYRHKDWCSNQSSEWATHLIKNFLFSTNHSYPYLRNQKKIGDLARLIA